VSTQVQAKCALPQFCDRAGIPRNGCRGDLSPCRACLGVRAPEGRAVPSRQAGQRPAIKIGGPSAWVRKPSPFQNGSPERARHVNGRLPAGWFVSSPLRGSASTLPLHRPWALPRVGPDRPFGAGKRTGSQTRVNPLPFSGWRILQENWRRASRKIGSACGRLPLAMSGIGTSARQVVLGRIPHHTMPFSRRSEGRGGTCPDGPSREPRRNRGFPASARLAPRAVCRKELRGARDEETITSVVERRG
jgi:hypothetical protein